MAQDYDPQEIETRWQQEWERSDAFRTRDDLPREQCYYVLEMFPYPSGRLHMGHVRNYTIGDAVSRYQRLRGLHVLHPMGWDSFGLPAEQAAIERGKHPKTWTYENIAAMRGQLKRLGFSYDWRREFATSDPGYSHREQELVLDLVEKGLVYRKASLVNWSTGLNTVLANEQVVDGKCWRTGTPVVQKELPQWFIRTTAYAEELWRDLDVIARGWPEAVVKMQREWLGRSRGAEIRFPIAGAEGLALDIFTTRPDTVFGVTFMSVAPEHPLIDRLVTPAQKAAVQALRDELRSQSKEERTGENAAKKGVFTGSYAVNPLTGDTVPVYAANFVLADYGTGAVMAVPAHDTRDFAFAQTYGLPIKRVILEDGADASAPMTEAFTGVGTMVNSGEFDGLRSDVALDRIIDHIASRNLGRERITWRYRDWGISRQRYWGDPIPFVFGETQGFVPVRRQDLPVALPEDVVIDGRGNPLERHPTWAVTTRDGKPLTVPTAQGREPARRETDTMDTFMESSWYFARYCCHDNAAADLGCARPLDRARVDHWLPVDLYIGGIEHACMHLLYARFFQKALCDMGYSGVREPFKRLLCQGMVKKECYYRDAAGGAKQYFSPDEVEVAFDDKGMAVSAASKADGRPVTVGAVVAMSKMKRNGIDPQAMVERYGADTARLFVLFAAPPEKDLVWDEAGLAGCHRFIKRVWTYVLDHRDELAVVPAYAGKVRELKDAGDQALLRKVHAAVRRATEAMERDFGFNSAIAACMELSNALAEAPSANVRRRAVETLILLLEPMTPHLSAELWQRLGAGQISAARWPAWDAAELAEDEVEYPVQVNGKVRGRIRLPAGLDAAGLEAAVRAHADLPGLLGGKAIRKAVVVPGKIVNLVV